MFGSIVSRISKLTLYAAVLSILLSSAQPMVLAQFDGASPSSKSLPSETGRRSIKITLPRGKPGDLSYEKIEFDLELNVWLAGTDFANVPSGSVPILKMAFEERKQRHQLNSSAILLVQRAENFSQFEKQGLPPEALEFLARDLPETLPDKAARQRMLVDYKKAEIEAERILAEKIMEILTPTDQAKFLAGAAKLDAFLVHPVGEQFLQLSTAQKSAIRRRFELRKSYSDKRVVRSKELSVGNGQSKTNPPKSTSPGIAILKPFPPESKEEFEARMMIFAVLSRDQLTQFLRLNGSMSEAGQIEDWVRSMPDDRRQIATRMLELDLDSIQP